MQRYVILSLLGLTLLLGIMACAPMQAEPPVRTQSGYTLSIETKPDTLWVKGPVSYTPNNQLGLGGLIVHVRDAQGQPVEGVPVSFTVESDWEADVTMWTDESTAEDGRARAIIQPSFEGDIKVYVRVDNSMQVAEFHVVEQVFGNTTADPTLIGLRLPL